MNDIPTELQLKIALVKALPTDLIAHGSEEKDLFWVNFNDTVNPTEWPAIVWKVEDNLPDDQFVRAVSQRVKFCEALSDNDTKRLRIYDSWQIRARALAAIGAITI